ncbi:MAG: hypothetical protein MMC33_002797 [Icmadophila ericetorum]|nr:hypothetical protein [Icmadophila ericetorum]
MPQKCQRDEEDGKGPLAPAAKKWKRRRVESVKPVGPRLLPHGQPLVWAELRGYTEISGGIMMQTKDHDENSARIRYFSYNQKHKIPFILIVGKDNPACPVQLPHQHCVMGHFQVTHNWPERTPSGLLTWMHRLEKLDLETKSWWGPKNSPLSLPVACRPITVSSELCSGCSEDSLRIYEIGFLCLTKTTPSISLSVARYLPSPNSPRSFSRVTISGKHLPSLMAVFCTVVRMLSVALLLEGLMASLPLSNKSLKLSSTLAEPEIKGEFLTMYSAYNFGTIYPHTAEVGTKAFSEAPPAIIEGLQQITRVAAKCVQDYAQFTESDEKFLAFNQNMLIGYMGKGKMDWHDDGEKHGDILVMHGSAIQKDCEHMIKPKGDRRFAMTCRYIRPEPVQP